LPTEVNNFSRYSSKRAKTFIFCFALKWTKYARMYLHKSWPTLVVVHWIMRSGQEQQHFLSKYAYVIFSHDSLEAKTGSNCKFSRFKYHQQHHFSSNASWSTFISVRPKRGWYIATLRHRAGTNKKVHKLYIQNFHLVQLKDVIGF
jgi:hypothetical protein